MQRKLFFASTLILCVTLCCAQEKIAKQKWLNHYAGVQANQLIKQIINLNSSNTAISNPYLLTYSINSIKYGWGLQAGIGYNYQRIADSESSAPHESKITELFYRIGVGRKFILGKRWQAGCGFDVIGDYQLNKTFTSTVVDITTTAKDSTTSIATDKTESSGYGAQFALGFHLTDRILLSTEATYYFLKSETKQSVLNSQTITDTTFPQNNSETLSSSNSGTEVSNFSFNLPVALFLVIKF